MPQLTRELTEIRKENDRLRYEVSIAVEDEVRKVIDGKRVGLEFSLGAQHTGNSASQAPLRAAKSYDLPRQMNDPF